MIAIGETLRRERLKRNLELQQISDELKLSRRFLEAIENEQFDRLPGGVFTRSFVRQYARLLGLDEEELAAEVVRLTEPPPDTFPAEAKKQPSVNGFPLPPAVSWDRISDGIWTGWPDWVLGLALAVVVTLACSGIYVWWERSQRPPAHTAQQQSASIAQPAQPAPSAPPSEPAPIQTPAVEQPVVSASAPAPSAPVAAAPSTTQAAGTGAANLQRAGSATGAASAVDPGAPLQVQLTAKESVWVRASSNGTVLFTITMAANETRTVEAKGSLELRLGNAGGIDIAVNGKPMGPVGPEGQIRTVQVTSGGFSIVAPPKPAPIDPL
jgi:cytoskeleton protein RodZ